jgi:hypothetical protein
VLRAQGALVATGDLIVDRELFAVVVEVPLDLPGPLPEQVFEALGEPGQLTEPRDERVDEQWVEALGLGHDGHGHGPER